MPASEWVSLKKSKAIVTIAPCGHEGFPRTSKLGTPHFVHKSAMECPWARESAEHLAAKAEIARACSRAGWEVTTEFAENDWRADVLASRFRTRVAFEVQLSSQSFEETKQRQQAYARDRVEGCWFLSLNMMKDFPNLARKDLPCFYLFRDGQDGFSLLVEGRAIDLGEAVEALLCEQLQFRARLTGSGKTRVALAETDCWKCKAATNFWFLLGNQFSRCGVMFEAPIDEVEAALLPSVVEGVRGFISAKRGQPYRIRLPGPSGLRTDHDNDLLPKCGPCGAPLFHDFLKKRIVAARLAFLQSSRTFEVREIAHVVAMTSVLVPELGVIERPHWCYSKTKEFCDG
ncbi:MAG: competence protein CoiA [Terriglobales bacterium]